MIPRLLGGLLLAVIAGPGPRAEEGGTFIVELPAHIRDASTVMLHLQQVRLPRNRPVVLRVYAVAGDGKETFLGSHGVLADSPDATGTRTVAMLPVEVTRNLQHWLAEHPQASKLKLHVLPVDGKGNPLDDLEWSVKAIDMAGRKGN